MCRPVFLVTAVILAATIARADDAATLMARDKAASGGAHWDAVQTLETRGTLHAGGLDGTFRSVQDLARMRSVTGYRVGPIGGADGYDGTHGWSRDPGGEVAVLDAPEVRRRAVSQAWLDARGYWYPARRPARFGRLRLDDLAVDGIAGDIYTGDKGSFASRDVSANIGGGVLRRFTVAFDYERKRMYLAPNAAFAIPDAFDRSGLRLLGAGAVLRVADVAANSAAARAGLQVDDRLTMIGGEQIAAHSLADWRARLCELPAGTRLVIEYQRAGRHGRTELILADRIAPAARPASTG